MAGYFGRTGEHQAVCEYGAKMEIRLSTLKIGDEHGDRGTEYYSEETKREPRHQLVARSSDPQVSSALGGAEGSRMRQ